MKVSKLNENGSEDIQVKLYTLLIDQMHKYTSVFWQFPLALLAANSFAVDKFLQKPVILLGLSFIDGALIYAFSRLIYRQKAIIEATQNAEGILIKTGYKEFIPVFKKRKPSAQYVTLWVLKIVTGFLAIYSMYKIIFP